MFFDLRLKILNKLKQVNRYKIVWKLKSQIITIKAKIVLFRR